MRRAILAAVAAASLAAACGKKAPPRPPILYLPAAPAATAQEVGRTAHLQIQIPAANADGSRPAVLDRVLVYGYTGTPDLKDLDTFFKKATLVAAVPITPEPRPGEEETDDTSAPPKPSALPRQGDTVTVSELITPALAVPVPPEESSKERKPADVELPSMAVPLGGGPSEVPTRTYYVLGETSRDRHGSLAPTLSVPLVPPPAAPGKPTVTYTETAITVTWTPPALVRRPVQLPVAPVAAPPPPSTAAPAGAQTGATVPVFGIFVPLAPPAAPLLAGTPIGPSFPASAYDVFDVDPQAPAPAGVRAEGDGQVVPGALPKPLNSAPLDATTYTDTRMNWGATRCYAVRTVDTYGTLTIESQASPATCVTLKDTFPPAPPRGLQAVASEGAISLIWAGNSEADLAGYLVLRAQGTGPLAPLTPKPITETTFRDTGVHAGEAYTYVVVAVDRAGNRSAPSNRAQETAR